MKNYIEPEERYKVYTLNRMLDSNRHLSLMPVEFKGFVSNNFRTEKEAIEALVEDEKTYTEYVILKTVILRNE